MIKSVIFVTGSLADGGAEKVMSILASGCAELGADVTLVVLRPKKIVYPVSDKVKIVQFTDEGKLATIKRIRQGRMVSYFGHPLLTAEIMILTFSFNTLVNYCIEKKSIFYTVYYSLISVIGIGMCGGKTGLVLIAVEFALLYVNKKGLKYFIIVAAAVYWAYGYGLLDTVIGRFIAGFESGDITTGRNTALLRVIQGGVLRFNLLIGHAGMNLSERMIAALEYPPLRWAYLFGVWFSVLMCVVLFAIPAIKILKNKNIKIFIVFLILVLDVNSYNGITTQSDQMLLYCVSVFLLLNLSYKHILDISCKKSVLRVLRVALVISLNVILYKLLVGKYAMNSWGEWIMYAVIASIIALVTAGLIYFITERNQFLTCINMIIKRKVKR